MEKSLEHKTAKEECSFTPEISKNSLRLLKKREHNKEFQKVEDRLIGYINRGRTTNLPLAIHTAEMKDDIHYQVKNKAGLFPVANCRSQKSSPPKHDLNLTAQYNLEEEIQVEQQQTGKQGDMKDCNRELIFSFKKLRGNESNVCIPIAEDPYNTEQFLNFKSRELQSKDLSTSNQDSCESRDYEEERDKILRLRKEELKRRKDEALTQRPSLLNKEKENLCLRHLGKIAHQKGQNSKSQTKPPSHKSSIVNQTIGAGSGENKSMSSLQDNKITLQENKNDKKKKVQKKFEEKWSKVDSLQRTVEDNRRVKNKKMHESVERLSISNHRANKSELIEKYGVKIKRPNVDTIDIQQTVFAGDTTSMLQNLKKLNSNLRKCSNLECIIKNKVSKNEVPFILIEQNPLIKSIDIGKENLSLVGITKSKPASKTGLGSSNPLMELVNRPEFHNFN